MSIEPVALPFEPHDARRLVAISGCHNLRDMGGYPTTDGRSLKWRTLYRSGTMKSVDEENLRALSALGISAVCDLRTEHERLREPAALSDVHYYSRDYDMSGGDLKALFATRFTREAATAAMQAAYAQLPYEQAPSYQALFRMLLAGQVPVVFNCSAGKDRTGVAAALILSLLGVPRDIVTHDYLLTNEAIESLHRTALTSSSYGHFTSMAPEDYWPLLRAEQAYLDSAFASIDQRSGGLTGYVRDVLELSPADIEQLQSMLLE